MPHQQEPDKDRKGSKAREGKKRPKENGQQNEEKKKQPEEPASQKG
jgi:hypothetical protein